MSTWIAVFTLLVVALIAALPGDRARRGVAFPGLGPAAAIVNAVLPGLAFWVGGGAFRGVIGLVALIGAITAGNVLADRVATAAWGPVTAR